MGTDRRKDEQIALDKVRIEALEVQCNDLMRPVIEEGNQAIRLLAFEEPTRELLKGWDELGDGAEIADLGFILSHETNNGIYKLRVLLEEKR